VVAEAPRRDIVHLAAHGEARLDNPLFAHINLADGQLSMVDVFNLRLDGALVTLSACETGRSAVRGGDELVGLSRGFLFAGAATLVQSLWRVDDSATARLMQQFYSGLTHGLAPGAALGDAQHALLDEGLHPHLWGAFQLVGRDGLGRDGPPTNLRLRRAQ
jgi:CHAT domain-containing protein